MDFLTCIVLTETDERNSHTHLLRHLIETLRQESFDNIAGTLKQLMLQHLIPSKCRSVYEYDFRFKKYLALYRNIFWSQSHAAAYPEIEHDYGCTTEYSVEPEISILLGLLEMIL